MTDKVGRLAERIVQLCRGLASRLQRNWVLCLVLAIIGCIVRLPALQGEPLWDDDYLTHTNPFIKSPLFIFEVFRHYLFQDAFSPHYRPVQNLSYMADYLFWNTNFYGFHLSSLLLHVGSGLLLYFLLRKLINQLHPGFRVSTLISPEAHRGAISWFAFFAALLWMVHPVHSAAIDYVSGRADSLAFGFACGAWLLYFKGRESQTLRFRISLYGLAWLCGLLALCSRESGCIWVGLFLLYLLVFERSAHRMEKWLPVVACLVMLAAYYGLRSLPPSPPPRQISFQTPPALRVVLMLRALGDYARLLVFPSNLHMERTVFDPAGFQTETGRWGLIEHEYLSIIGLLFAALLVSLSLRRGPGRPLRIFGAMWFLLGYLPISNVIELNATVAEHWLYLPSAGFFIFVIGCVIDLPRRWQCASIAVACVAALALSVRSVLRSSDWVSTETFAQRTIVAGGGSPRVLVLLAQVYSNRGEYAAAERVLIKALQLCADYPIARSNLANALFHQGKKEQAEMLFVRGVQAAPETRKEYPRTWIAGLNLAQLRFSQNDPGGAIAVLEKSRHDYPNTWDLLAAESELLRQADKVDESLAIIRPFAENNWWHYPAWLAVGRLMAQKGDVPSAADALRHASWLDLHETAALNLIALMRMRANQLEDACRIQRRAVARQPDEPRQYLILSDILTKMGRADESRAALAQVSRLRTLADSKGAN